jgi:nucleoside-diphosphate-sugar epimerase
MMRVYPTGAAGFVGSNVARAFAGRHDARLLSPTHRRRPPAGAPYVADTVDLTDAAAVRRSAEAHGP